MTLVIAGVLLVAFGATPALERLLISRFIGKRDHEWCGPPRSSRTGWLDSPVIGGVFIVAGAGLLLAGLLTL